MISYKVKGIILAVIISLASIMMPFSVYADSYVSPSYVNTTERDKWQNAGGNVVNFSEDPLTGSTPSKLTFTFNDNYYGFVSFQPYSGSSVWNDSTCFIAGGVGYYNYRNSSAFNPKYIDGVKITYVNLFLPDSNVDLSQIISILTAIENDTTSIDTTVDTILTNLQSVLNQIIISNGYLQTITKLRQLTIPYESYSFVAEFISRFDPVTFRTYYYYQFPIFNINNTFNISYSGFTSGPRSDYIYKFWINKNIQNVSDLLNYFKIYNPQDNNNDISVNIESLYMGYINYELWHEITIIVPKPESGNLYIGLSYINSQPAQIMPIYKGYSNNNRMSSDFALMFGFSNQLLDDLHIIALGTNQSNSAASDLENEASEYSDIADDVIGVEEGLTSNFETEVNKIDLNTGLNGFGGNFMTSATWVRTQFDRLTENTPYGTLVVYGLTLGFALLMLGKVFL